jgi:gluconate 2-dehydrogenase alpha chain
MATLKPVDAVVIGVGWTGGIVASELTKAGLHVVGLERGLYRDTNPDFQVPQVHDELEYGIRLKLFQDASKETYTFRNTATQGALPIRQFGSFLPGDGLGGAGVHWNGVTWRFSPWDFETRKQATARYGAGIFGADCISQDWGITYDELEPYYDRFEYLCGIGGKAGNIAGKKIPGGNVFEGPRRRDYPNPPMKQQYSGALFTKATRELGYHPFPQPSGNSTRAYMNPEGVQMGLCVYCGYCERFSCEMGAKASLQTTLLPKLMKSPNFELRHGSKVLRINLDSSGKKAVSVTYLDGKGIEQTQPAEMIFVTAWSMNNVRLLLLSKIGTPYDPVSGKGVIGRNYSYQINGNATLFYEGKHFNNFMASGAIGTVIDDFNADNFDHSRLGFVGGAVINQTNTNARPIVYHPTPPGTPKWGKDWKSAVVRYYNNSASLNAFGAGQSYRGNYLDLDPTYADSYGQPLLRMTMDWNDNERRLNAFMIEKLKQIGKAMGAKQMATSSVPEHYDITPYQSTHNLGGAVMGADPSTSAVNKYSQSWDVPNVFVLGASAFPQNTGYAPTGTIGALAYFTTDAVVKRYIKAPGNLAG